MNNFIYYLDEIEKLKKEKSYDEAWKVANEAVIKLASEGDDMWYMMYYQMADILKREKRYFQATEKMGLVIHYLGGVGGKGHERFIRSLLSKTANQDLYDQYVLLCKQTKPDTIASEINNLLARNK